MDFLLFTFALVSIKKEFALTNQQPASHRHCPHRQRHRRHAFGASPTARPRARHEPSASCSTPRHRRMATAQNLWQLIAGACSSASAWRRMVLRLRARRGDLAREASRQAMGIMQSGRASRTLRRRPLRARPRALRMALVLFLIGAAPPSWRYHPAHGRGAGGLARARSHPFTLERDLLAEYRRRTFCHARREQRLLRTGASPRGCRLPRHAVAKAARPDGHEIRRWFVVLQLGAFFGYISFGWIADRIGRRPAFTLFMIAATIVVPIFAFGARSALTLLVIGRGRLLRARLLFPVRLHAGRALPTRIRASAQGFCYKSRQLFSAAAPYHRRAATKHGLGSPSPPRPLLRPRRHPHLAPPRDEGTEL